MEMSRSNVPDGEPEVSDADFAKVGLFAHLRGSPNLIST